MHALAYNLANFMRTLALPEAVKQWSLTSLREKLIKIGAKVVRHGRYVVFQMAEVAVPREVFPEILRLDLLLPPPLRVDYPWREAPRMPPCFHLCTWRRDHSSLEYILFRMNSGNAAIASSWRAV